MIKRTVSVLTIALLLLAGAASAQVDDRARQLLEGLNPDGMTLDLTSLDQTMTMTIYQDGGDLVTKTRIVVDYVGERAAMVSEVMGMATTMVYKDGSTVLKMNGMAIPVPAGMDSAFDGVFDQTATANLLDDPDAVATYDGQVSYGDVLSGQQVTYTGNFGIPGSGLDATTVRFVFDDSGRLLGQVVEADGMVIAYVFVGEPKVDGAMYYDAEMYELVGGTATPFASMRYDAISVNQPIDESLFE